MLTVLPSSVRFCPELGLATMEGKKSKAGRLELWGGLECTINRIGDRYLDQFVKGGHLERPQDLDLIAELGIRTLRYPVLWERVAPERADQRDWRFSDERLSRLRKLGIGPIAGLVHHGSGPTYTNLISDDFPIGLAGHARAVAERYPWIDAYTPVNEPLTTARFSGLYGHWFPHGNDTATFAKALVNQVKAVVLSMAEIRKVNPRARLVQTDDLGKTHATSRLQYQAEFENVRRWITWDLLSGLVDREHPMWRELTGAGIGEGELGWFLDHPCPPDVLGINYYLTSERFLDHRRDRYPERTHGGNAFDAYADIEAVRVLAGGIEGAAGLLRAAWERYRRPIAITECHLGCTREEQVRWLNDVWRQAQDVRAEGADVRAVTVWSMFGAFDWCSLLTRDDDRYEPGVFDLRAPAPRRTALAETVRELATSGTPEPSPLDGEGWWQRPIRLLYPPVLAPGHAEDLRPKQQIANRPPLLIVGARGTLGQAFARLCELRGLEYRLVSREEMNAARPVSVHAALLRYAPWAVVNAAGSPGIDCRTVSGASFT